MPLLTERPRTGAVSLTDECEELLLTIAEPYPHLYAKLAGMPVYAPGATEELQSLPPDLRARYDACIQAKGQGLLEHWMDSMSPEQRQADRLFVEEAMRAYLAKRVDEGADVDEIAVVVHPSDMDAEAVQERATDVLDQKAADKRSRNIRLAMGALALGAAGIAWWRWPQIKQAIADRTDPR